MIKVFLVEDEFVVREGIKRNIDWALHGYEFCGEAGDGELALPLIRKLLPDIVITDIKMPFMDGLELSKHIKKEFPGIEIIILSGYEEFEYAKEGIKLGVAQYLTKPITGEELLAEIDQVSERILSRKREEELKGQFEKEMEENYKKDRRELFHDLVSGEYSATELLAKAESLDIDLSAVWYNIVLLYMKSVNHEISEYSNSSISVENQIIDIIKENDCLIFDRNLEGKAILFTGDSIDQLVEKQNNIVAKLEATLQEYSNIRYFGGIGEPVNRMSNLHASFESARRAMAHRYFISDNRFVSSDAMEQDTVQDTDSLDMRQIDAKRIDRKNLVKFLKLGSREDIPVFVDDFSKSAGESAMLSNLFRQYIAMDSYFCVATFLEELGRIRGEVEIPAVEPQSVGSVASTQEYISKLFDIAIEARESIATNRYGEIVEEAVKYIEENYSDEELSLNALASHVNVSPNHLSTIFSQQTGSTFIKYLTEYRIEKAKELLRCTGKRSSEISEEVGYKDPHYFSYMFKKSVGMTPTKYRGGKDSEEDT